MQLSLGWTCDTRRREWVRVYFIHTCLLIHVLLNILASCLCPLPLTLTRGGGGTRCFPIHKSVLSPLGQTPRNRALACVPVFHYYRRDRSLSITRTNSSLFTSARHKREIRGITLIPHKSLWLWVPAASGSPCAITVMELSRIKL